MSAGAEAGAEAGACAGRAMTPYHVAALIDGQQRVIRRCGYQKSAKACYHYDDEDHAEVVCECFEDACNSAHGLQGAAAARALVAAAAAAALLFLAR